MASPYTTKMLIEIDFKVRLTFWEALKLRLAGHGFPALVDEVRESLRQRMQEQPEDDDNG